MGCQRAVCSFLGSGERCVECEMLPIHILVTHTCYPHTHAIHIHMLSTHTHAIHTHTCYPHIHIHMLLSLSHTHATDTYTHKHIHTTPTPPHATHPHPPSSPTLHTHPPIYNIYTYNIYTCRGTIQVKYSSFHCCNWPTINSHSTSTAGFSAALVCLAAYWASVSCG